MKKTNHKITRYDHKNFYIDIVETKTDFEYWLTEKGYGISTFVYGFPKKQPYTGETETFNSFLDTIKATITDDIYYYLLEKNKWEDL